MYDMIDSGESVLSTGLAALNGTPTLRVSSQGYTDPSSIGSTGVDLSRASDGEINLDDSTIPIRTVSASRKSVENGTGAASCSGSAADASSKEPSIVIFRIRQQSPPYH